ncbi:MAG: hypothetical protein ACLT8E_07145 [Akkermansia sp.]
MILYDNDKTCWRKKPSTPHLGKIHQRHHLEAGPVKARALRVESTDPAHPLALTEVEAPRKKRRKHWLPHLRKNNACGTVFSRNPPLRSSASLFLLCLLAPTLAGAPSSAFPRSSLIQQAISETLAQTMKELQKGTAPPFPSPCQGGCRLRRLFTLDGGLFYLSMAGLVVCWLMLVYIGWRRMRKR